MPAPVAADQTYPYWALAHPIRRWTDPPKRTVDRLDPRPGDRVVDLGAGVGYFAPEVLARVGPGGHLTLVDVNGANLERFARRHGPDPRLSVHVGSAASVPSIASGSLDRVLLANVLCDVVDKAGVLDEAWRVLRPGGTAYVSFHWAATKSPAHPLRVTAEEWTGLAGRHPWIERAAGSGRRIAWHRLEKPTATPAP